jgi:flavin-dependent dehydrogenase
VRRALIIGAGVAGITVAHILGQRGWHVALRGSAPARVPAVVMNQVTAQLLVEIWEARDLFSRAHGLAERVVAWDTGIAVQPEGSIAVRMPELLADLLTRVARLPNVDVDVDMPAADARAQPDHDLPALRVAGFDWVIDATGRRARVATGIGGATRSRYGVRQVIAAMVTLRGSSFAASSCIESLASGWLFLAPIGGSHAFLQLMTLPSPSTPATTLADALAQSSLIQSRIADGAASATAVDASPEVLHPMHGATWLAVGEAAMSLDPLSGDGTGSATRGAMLGAAVLEAAARGESPSECLDHYDRRLRAAFRSHLLACVAHYERARSSAVWAGELRRMRAGASDLRDSDDAWRFGLRGLSLERLDHEPSPATP